jgi:hypothetical protein
MRMTSVLGCLAALLATTAMSSYARADGPISNNPDDYDVAKYQSLYDQSIARLSNAQALLASLQARMDDVGVRLAREQAKLDELQRAIDVENATAENARAQIQQLRQSIETAEAERRQLQQQDIPAAEREFAEQARRRDALRNQLAGADQEAARREAVARDRRGQAQALAQNAEEKRQRLAQADAQLNGAVTQLQQLEASDATLRRRVEELRAHEVELERNERAAQDQVKSLASETERLKQESDAASSRAAEAERVAAAAEQKHDPNARQLRARATEARRQAEQARATYDHKLREYESAQAYAQRTGQELAQTRASRADSERQLAGVQSQLVEARRQVDTVRPQRDAAARDYNEAQRLASAAGNDAAVAEREASETRNMANGIRAALSDSERKAAELGTLLERLRTRASNLDAAIARWHEELREQHRIVEASRERLRALAGRADYQRSAVAATQNDYASAARDRDQAALVVTQLQQDTAALAQRLQDVRNNLANGIAVASGDGQRDGAQDGAVEGGRQGAFRGEREGNDVGSREGRAQGMREGTARAAQEGAAEGAQVGRTEGTERGTSEGRARGETEGRAAGQAKGLQDGYDQGRSEGYSEGYPQGEQAGHAMGGYAKGKSEGYADGKSRAEGEASGKGRAEGSQKAREEFLNANAADVRLSNRGGAAAPVGGEGILPSPSDVKSANFGYPRWENYNPRRQYPHPDLQGAYGANYQQGFFAAAGAEYDRSYPATYQRFHDQAFESARQQYASQPYPEERKAAYDAARAQAFEAARAQASDAAYQQAYQPAFDQARQAALPTRRAEGRTDGVKAGFEEGKSKAYEADLAKGRDEGSRAGWDENYKSAYDAAYKRAYDETVAYFTNNAVLRFEGAMSVDANDDGVNAPGESVSVTITMRNFGKASQSSPVTVALSNPSAGLVLDKPTDTLVALPGQSRAVVTEVAGLRLAPGAEAGKTESVTVTVSRDGKTLGQVSLSLPVSYPYSVADIQRDDYPAAEQENKVVVKVRNGSAKLSAAPVTVKLVSLDGLATVTGTAAPLGQLASGETKPAELAYTFNKENAEKRLSFEVQVYEGTWLLGRRQFNVEATKHWAYTPTSTGLLVVTSGELVKRAEEAAALDGFAFDVWDVRVEGQLTAEAALRYTDKTIVIASVNALLKDATAEALRAYLDRGGQLYAGENLDGASYTSVGRMLSNARQAVSSHERIGNNVGVHQANFFVMTEPRYLIAESFDMREVTSAAIAQSLAWFEPARKPLAEKMGRLRAAAAAGDEAKVRVIEDALLYELVKEMSDNAAVKGDNFKAHRSERRLTAFINTALSLQGAERREFLMLTPALNQARERVEKDGWFRSTPIKDTMKPLNKAYDAEVLGRKGD